MRADWRFLVPWNEERAPVIHIDPDRLESWMKDDGWAVSVGPADIVATTDVATTDVATTDVATTDVATGKNETRPTRLVTWVTRFGRGPASPIPDGHVVRRYLPVPLTRPQSYLPLDHVPAIAAWLRHRLRWGPFVRPVALAVSIFGRLIPGTVVVATSPDVEQWPEPTTADLLLTTSGKGEGSRVVRLPVDQAGIPVEVEKLSNRPRYETDSMGEQAALAHIAAQLPPSVVNTVPRALGEDRLAGSVRVRETHLDGPTMAQALSKRTRRRSAEQALEDVAGWLLEVHDATAIPGVWGEGEFDEFLRAPLEELRDVSGDRCQDIGHLVDAVCRRSAGAAMARALRHYDVGPWNVILGSGVFVVDWELRSPRPPSRLGLAGADLHYLVTYWRHVVVGSTSHVDENLVSGLLPASGRRRCWAIETGCSTLKNWFAAAELGREGIAAVWVHNWLEQAVYRSHRNPADGTRGRAFDYLRLAAANPNRLFDPMG